MLSMDCAQRVYCSCCRESDRSIQRERERARESLARLCVIVLDAKDDDDGGVLVWRISNVNDGGGDAALCC